MPDLENQRLKARYADAIPLDLFKSEQERITRELAGAQQIIGRCSMEINAVLRVVEEALLLCADAHRLAPDLATRLEAEGEGRPDATEPTNGPLSVRDGSNQTRIKRLARQAHHGPTEAPAPPSQARCAET